MVLARHNQGQRWLCRGRREARRRYLGFAPCLVRWTVAPRRVASSTVGAGIADDQGSQDVDAYLADVPGDARAVLERLRKTIRAAAGPEAQEGFSYGIPAFKLHGRPLVAYAALKNHCSFFPMSPAVIEAHAKELSDYETAKGTIRFTADKPLPSTLVRKLVKARAAESDAT